MKLSIVIPVFNKWNFTKSCLSDLSQLPDDHEIIVIDNASTDQTKSELDKLNDPKLKIIHNNENLYHSKACNQGYVAATSDIVLFLNNDIRVKSNHENWTNSIINTPSINSGLVGPTMGQLDQNLNFVREAQQTLIGNSYISGWCLAGKKSILKQLEVAENQVWNEKYPMYFNDTDLSFRAKKLKLTLNVISIPSVIHFGQISASQINVNKLYNEGRSVFLRDWSKK